MNRAASFSSAGIKDGSAAADPPLLLNNRRNAFTHSALFDELCHIRGQGRDDFKLSPAQRMEKDGAA